MKLSFDDKESFEETVGSLNFNNPPSDPNSELYRQVGSRSSMLSQERNKGICFENPASDPNIIPEVRRVPVGTGNSNSTPLQERSEDT